MRRLSNESKVTLIYKIMRDNMATDLWKEGDQFSSFDVARKYSIGRTTVNDAIKLLEKKGFVTILPNVGFRVNRISAQSVNEYMEVRLAIEHIITKYLLQIEDTERLSQIKDRFKLAMTSFELGQQEVAMQGIEEYHLSIADMLESHYVRNIFSETEDLEYYIMSQIMVNNPKCFPEILEIKAEFLVRLEEGDSQGCHDVLGRKSSRILECMLQLLEEGGRTDEASQETL